jgi:AcrR family transcriptional regulator
MGSSPSSLREKQKLQTRTEIVRRAFELFARHGYDRVPVEMICEAVGIARATFFNYFPKKDLILREIARTRVEKLKGIVARFASAGHEPTFDDIVGLFLEIAEENARMTARSRRLVLEIAFQQIAREPISAIRAEAIATLRSAVERIQPRGKAPAQLMAETLFAVYMATMLEWLIRESEPASWLTDNLRARLELAVKGMQ